MRRAVLVAAVVSFLLAGTAAAAASEPQLQIVPGDQAWADFIVLTSADLGAAWQPLSDGGGGDPRENSICAGPGPDESDLTITAGGTSDFVRADGGALVASTATIWQTADQAQSDWDRTVQPSLLDCVAADLASASTKKIKLVVTGKRELTYQAVAPRTAAYRFSIVYKTRVKIKKRWKTRSAPATFDLVVLGNGRATAWLATLSFNRTPLGESSKQALTSTLAKRMTTDPSASS